MRVLTLKTQASKSAYPTISQKPSFKKTLVNIGLCLFCAYALVSHADYRKLVEDDFWKKIYPDGGLTFYCQIPFSKASPVLNVGHIYSTAWISESLGCRSERTCMHTNTRYEEILSDMHNMVPVNAYQHLKLKNAIFGELDNSLEPNECGVRKRHHLIEPREDVKGDIARIYFYMHYNYQLPLNSNYAFMKEWHRSDPPDAAEKAKNTRIKQAQGNGNPFIEQPELVDTLDF